MRSFANSSLCIVIKEADIGISMGIQGTEAARENSDLVILNGDFASVVLVLMWRRCVQNNIQKFIQFQLTANVVALVRGGAIYVVIITSGTESSEANIGQVQMKLTEVQTLLAYQISQQKSKSRARIFQPPTPCPLSKSSMLLT
ncbi:putative calcium-transporting ATPase 13, plasma membrane-type protein [Tanacetum coccineum]